MKNQNQPSLRTPMLIVGSRLFYERAFPAGMKEHFDLHYFDHKGFYHNPGLLESAYQNLEEIVAEIEIFRQNFGLEKFFLFGHSGHAYMTLEYAKSFPNQILGLVLCGCSPDLSPKSHLAAENYFTQLADENRKQIFEQDMAGLFSKIQAEPDLRFTHFVLCQKAKNWFNPNYDAAWLWKDVPTHLPTLDYVWGKLFRDYEVCQNLEKITFPVLFLQGKYDFVAGPASSWESIISKLPDVKESIFELSGHYPMVDEPEAFLEVLCHWTNNLIN
ncbi:alpha/beta hydrolase [Algoriphagus lacus]|uniref:Alpha/beta hydrolase n=1 Tax=Algoriphagus lacus TaxID=2056311 RepID=A0A418PSE3_9BACT|nr:alpha/beta hydrolase [Algoriphagus lacus]RIW15780.1 alpha/beta hydrolase [Algoriphagus lacus]